MGVPVSLAGIGGPGAPHVFRLERRCATGLTDADITDVFWKTVPPHAHDVILRPSPRGGEGVHHHSKRAFFNHLSF